MTNALKAIKIELYGNDEIEEKLINFTISKCRKLVRLLSHSTKLNDALIKDQETNSDSKPLCLIQDVSTR